MNTARSAVWTPAAERHGELSNVELANVRLLGEARLVVVCAAILLALLDPLGADRAAILALLTLYAAFSYSDLRQVKAGTPRRFPLNHWIDVAFYMPVVAISGGLTSDFSVFLLLPVFSACLGSGVLRGLAVATVCAAVLSGITLATTRSPAAAFIADMPLGPIILVLVMAVVIARWAHAEVTIARRLAFCSDLGQIFTPQHDVRHAVSALCEMLRDHQRADACIVLLKDTRSSGWLLFQVDARSNTVRGEAFEAAVMRPLLLPVGDRAVLYRRSSLTSDVEVCRAYDPVTLKTVDDFAGESVGELAQLLEAKSLVSLPLQSRSQTLGRLHLTSSGVPYTRNDVEFLAHVAAQVGVMIENMQLVDRLTVEIASAERKKISRDLHDWTIQPYIGLKLALEALHRKVGGDPVLVHEVDDLIKMASDGISELRHYVGHLKTAAHGNRRNLLLPAIRYQADKFSEYYGIRTEVVAEADIAVAGPLFDEVMYLVREGLSNIRRHTRARSARIGAAVSDGKLTLRFTNDTGPGETPETHLFNPRSLSERAVELDGRVVVERLPGGITVVSIAIPV